MKAEDVQRTVDQAIEKAALRKQQQPKLLSSNGSCYIAYELKEYLMEKCSSPYTDARCIRKHKVKLNAIIGV